MAVFQFDLNPLERFPGSGGLFQFLQVRGDKELIFLLGFFVFLFGCFLGAGGLAVSVLRFFLVLPHPGKVVFQFMFFFLQGINSGLQRFNFRLLLLNIFSQTVNSLFSKFLIVLNFPDYLIFLIQTGSQLAVQFFRFRGFRLKPFQARFFGVNFLLQNVPAAFHLFQFFGQRHQIGFVRPHFQPKKEDVFVFKFLFILMISPCFAHLPRQRVDGFLDFGDHIFHPSEFLPGSLQFTQG